MAKYTKDQVLNYRKIAQFNFIPFVVGYFSGKHITHANLLPIGRSEVLTEYTCDILIQLLPKAVWLKLAHAFGWTTQDYLLNEKVSSGKLWDSCKENDSFLTFSDYSIELLICLFNDASVNKKKDDSYIQITSKCKTNGDLVLEFLTYLLWLESGHPNKNKVKTFNHNFLCQLTKPYKGSSHNKRRRQTHDLASVKSIWFMLPWLNKYWASDWVKSEKRRWKNIDTFIDYSEKQNTILDSWFKFLVDNEFYDQLNVFMRYYHGWRESGLVKIEKNVNKLCAGIRLSERQELIFRLQVHFDLIEKLEALYNNFITTHPIERDAVIARYLTDYGKLKFSKVAKDWRTLRSSLVAVVG